MALSMNISPKIWSLLSEAVRLRFFYNSQILLQFSLNHLPYISRVTHVRCTLLLLRLVVEKNEKAIENVVEPDITIDCDSSKLDERGGNGLPDMIVEILSFCHMRCYSTFQCIF